MTQEQTEGEKHILSLLAELMEIPSPSGYTDNIVHFVCNLLDEWGVSFELTRRGAIRATIPGEKKGSAKALVSHLDTLGAMVRQLKPNGRLAIAPVGHWSSRFAEGSRVTVVSEEGYEFRGTVLPLKASGHTYGDEIDRFPITWDHVEVRLDHPLNSSVDLEKTGLSVGDYVAFDPGYEYSAEGYINSRHLDNKAGVAVMLNVIHKLVKSKGKPPVTCHMLFTISEEVGSGASAVLHGDVSEMVAIDNATNAPEQNSVERGVTIAAMDSSGPFDIHLTRHLVHLCRDLNLRFAKDVFRYYRCDVASALEAGNDIRTALVCFDLDSSHGYERTHIDSLVQLCQLLEKYVTSKPLFDRDENKLGEIRDFPELPEMKTADVIWEK